MTRTRFEAVLGAYESCKVIWIDFSEIITSNLEGRYYIVSDELDEDSEPIEPEEGQLLVTEREMREWVKEVRSKLLRLMNSF